MIYFYQFIGILLIPIIKLNILRRINSQKESKSRYKERYGIPSIKKPSKKLIWIHAASIGEFKSSDFLINTLHKKYAVLITTTTVSAAEYAKKNYGDKVIHQFAPLDISLWVKKFIKYWDPALIIWIESDIWPTTMHLIKKNRIKALLVNIRMSPTSFNRWKKFAFIYKEILECFSEIFAQSELDKNRIKTLTKREIKFIGNLKLSSLKKISSKKQISNSIESKKSINLMIVSTHKKEEFKILPIIKKLTNQYLNLSIVIAPRHPERSDEILSICNSLKIPSRLEKEDNCNSREVLVINSFGNLEKYFETSDIVFLGGSLIPKGGHNPIEPAYYNCAIITGPYVFNWQNIYDEMVLNNACLMIHSIDDLENKIRYLINNLEKMNIMKLKSYEFTQKQFFDTHVLMDSVKKNLKDLSC